MRLGHCPPEQTRNAEAQSLIHHIFLWHLLLHTPYFEHTTSTRKQVNQYSSTGLGASLDPCVVVSCMVQFLISQWWQETPVTISHLARFMTNKKESQLVEPALWCLTDFPYLTEDLHQDIVPEVHYSIWYFFMDMGFTLQFISRLVENLAKTVLDNAHQSIFLILWMFKGRWNRMYF